MKPCKACKHFAWRQIDEHGGHWTIAGCIKRKLRFGHRRHWANGDKDFGISPMPTKCGEFKRKVSAE